MNLLIPYVYRYDHDDPLFNEFTYGDNDRQAKQLKTKLNKGDYIFFHTSSRGIKYITAYYVVDRVLDTSVVVKDRKITSKYKNPHIREFLNGERTKEYADVIVFGDPIFSRNLDRPLLFNRTLAERLSIDIKFRDDKTDTQSIGSATRAWRGLSGDDVEIILKEIEKTEKQGIKSETILSTDEVTEIIEKDIENFIERNSSLLGKNLELIKRQKGTPVGTIDLLYEDGDGNPVVVELKLNKIGRKAINQLRRYMNWIEKETKKKSKGILVCKGIMPAFEKELKDLKNISIFYYGWQLKVYKMDRKNDL